MQIPTWGNTARKVFSLKDFELTTAKIVPCPALSTDAIASVFTAAFWYPTNKLS